jgi:hypothetical protein
MTEILHPKIWEHLSFPHWANEQYAHGFGSSMFKVPTEPPHHNLKMSTIEPATHNGFTHRNNHGHNSN